MKKTLILILISLFARNINAQWAALGTVGLPANPDIDALAAKGATLFIGTWGNGVFRSVTTGSTWGQVNNALTNYNVWSLALSGPSVIAGTQNGLFISSSNGSTWTPKNNGLISQNIKSLFVNGAHLYAGTLGGGSHLSVNGGSVWTSGNTGMADLYVESYTVKGSTMFAGNDGSFGKQGGVYTSTTTGNSWTAINSGLPPNTSVYALAVSGTNLIAGTIGTGIYYSTNNGVTWTQSSLTSYNVIAFVNSGIYVFAATNGGGVYISADDGVTWSQTNVGLTNLNITALTTDSARIYAGTYDKVFYRAINDITGMANKGTEALNVLVYPNPASTSVTFEIKENLSNDDNELLICNFFGQEIKRLKNLKGQKIVFERENLPDGIYFYKLTYGGKQSRTGKIIFTN